MKAVLEFHEAVVGDELDDALIGNMAIELRNRNEVDAKLAKLKGWVKAGKLKGRYLLHICNHDLAGSGENRPCRTIPIQPGDTVDKIKAKLTAEGVL